MTHWPKTTQDVIYRLYLRRRLTLCCTALICLGALVPLMMQGAALWPLLPIALAGLLGFGLYNVLFPEGFADVIGFAVSGAALLALGFSDVQVGWGVYVALGLGVHLGMIWVQWLLDKIALPPIRVRYQADLPVPAERAAEALFTRANTRRESRVHGPADENGFVPVWMMNLNMIPEGDELRVLSEREKLAGPPDYYTRVLEEGPLYQCEQDVAALPEPGEDATAQTVARTDITPLGPEHCRYECTELTEHFTVLSLATWWLLDAPGDVVRDYTDQVLNRPSVAVRHVPPHGLMSVIALWLQSLRQSSHPE